MVRDRRPVRHEVSVRCVLRAEHFLVLAHSLRSHHLHLVRYRGECRSQASAAAVRMVCWTWGTPGQDLGIACCQEAERSLHGRDALEASRSEARWDCLSVRQQPEISVQSHQRAADWDWQTEAAVAEGWGCSKKLASVSLGVPLATRLREPREGEAPAH